MPLIGILRRVSFWRLNQLVYDEEWEAQKLKKLFIFSLKKLIFNRNVLDHKIVILFARNTSGVCCFNVTGEKLVNIVNNDLFLGDELFLSSLNSVFWIRILGLSYTFKQIFDKKNLVICFDTLKSTNEVFITFPRSDLS
jgi:hypothetical protein